MLNAQCSMRAWPRAFAISACRLMIGALFHASGSFVRAGGGCRRILNASVKDCAEVACENEEISLAPRASRALALFTRLLSRSSSNDHSLPATRHAKASPLCEIRRKLDSARFFPPARFRLQLEVCALEPSFHQHLANRKL